MLLDNITSASINGSNVKELWFGGNQIWSGDGWTLLTEKTTQTLTSQNTTTKYINIQIPTGYKYYKIEMTSYNSSGTFGVYPNSSSSTYITRHSTGTHSYTIEIDNSTSPYTVVLTSDTLENTTRTYTSKLTSLYCSVYYTATARVTYTIYGHN